MTSKSIAVKLGTFSVIAVVLLLILYNTMSNQISGGTREVTANFTNVSGLRPGDDVRAAGVPVGRVQSVDITSNGLAKVAFIIRKSQPIYTDTQLIVRYQNLLGQRYLSLVPGKASQTPMAPGKALPVSQTSPGFDLTALLNGFEPLFKTLEPAEFNKLSASIIAVLQGEGGTIETLLRETAVASNKLADNDQVFGQVIDNLTPVLENMAAHGDEFDSTINQVGALMTALAKERTSIGGSIDGLSKLSAATADLVTQARPDLARDFTKLTGLSQVIVDNQSILAKTLQTLPTATAAFSRPMSHGSWLDIYLCNVAVDLGGTKINLGSADGPYSAVCR